MPWNQREWEIQWLMAAVARIRYDLNEVEKQLERLREVEDGDRDKSESSPELDKG